MLAQCVGATSGWGARIVACIIKNKFRSFHTNTLYHILLNLIEVVLSYFYEIILYDIIFHFTNHVNKIMAGDKFTLFKN